MGEVEAYTLESRQSTVMGASAKSSGYMQQQAQRSAAIKRRERTREQHDRQQKQQALSKSEARTQRIKEPGGQLFNSPVKALHPVKFGRRRLPYSIGRFLASFIYRVIPIPRVEPPSKKLANDIRVVCISDTHDAQPEIPDGDLLVHAGDLTRDGNYAQIHEQLLWLKGLPHKHKVIVAGNHDRLLDATRTYKLTADELRKQVRQEMKSMSLTYLENDCIRLAFDNGRSLRIYGNPVTQGPSQSGAFKFDPGKDVFKGRVPRGTDVLVTHCPPKHYLDSHFGSNELLNEVFRVQPKLHIYGHIHPSRGITTLLSRRHERLYQRLCEGGTWLLTPILLFRLLILRIRNARSSLEKSTLLVNAAAFSKSANRPLGTGMIVDI